MNASESIFDYVVAGGGLVGTVLAARLSQSGHTVALLEAGPEDYSDIIMSPVAAQQLHATPYEFKFKSTRQFSLNDREINNYSGRLLGGSSAVNYGLWTRGHSVDYDAWGALVRDERWNYNSMVRYFKKVQHHHDDANGDPEKYGFEGPMWTTSGERNYPLGPSILTALKQAGHELNVDSNGGNPMGIGLWTENWRDAKRQPAGKVYDLSGATIMTDTTVARILIDSDSKTAKGVELVCGKSIYAEKEVIISCGALKTPQLLMLSGIGPSSQLSEHNIPVINDLPVGEGLHDKISTTIFWKLRHPEQGLALGSPHFNKPEFAHGMPMQYLLCTSTPTYLVHKALQADGVNLSSIPPSIPAAGRAHAEIFISYAPIASEGAGFRLPFDGTHISTPTILLLPTSRGRVTLANSDINADPVIDPNYLASALDWENLRSGMREALRFMETPEARAVVEGETPPPGEPPLTSDASDEDLNRRIKFMSTSFFQNAGTAAMGKVVDSTCKVFGIEGLRVCDASVLPLPISGHYQAPMYAFAEAMATAILKGE